MSTENFDAIIIGTGQSGKPLAGALGAAGWKTAVIERKHVGGTCINYGCTPTKTMVASARVAYLARRGADYGVHPDGADPRRHGRGLSPQAGDRGAVSRSGNALPAVHAERRAGLRRGAPSSMRRPCASHSARGASGSSPRRRS